MKCLVVIFVIFWIAGFSQERFKQNILTAAEGGGVMRTISHLQTVTVTDSIITYTNIDKNKGKQFLKRDKLGSIRVNVTLVQAYTDEKGTNIREYWNKDNKHGKIIVIKRTDGSYSTIYNVFDYEKRTKMFFQSDFLED